MNQHVLWASAQAKYHLDKIFSNFKKMLRATYAIYNKSANLFTRYKETSRVTKRLRSVAPRWHLAMATTS